MEPLAAFGLACNVMQAVDFGLKAIRTLEETSETGNTIADKDVQKSAYSMAESAKRVEYWLHQFQQASEPLTATEKDLQEVANRYIETADAIRKKMEPLAKDMKGRKLAVWKACLKNLLRRDDIPQLESWLQKLEATLQTKILIHSK